MSYSSEIDFNIESNNSESSMTLSNNLNVTYSNIEQVKPKQKFIEKESPNDFWLSKEKSTQALDIESKLKKSQFTSKNKIDTQSNQQQDTQYCNNKSMSAGRGFGNLNISNDIRYGGSSRMDTKEFKEKRESKQMLDFHFQYLDKDYQNPKNIVMPIPRGGDMTRKQKSANNTYSDRNNTIEKPKIQFDYS